MLPASTGAYSALRHLASGVFIGYAPARCYMVMFNSYFDTAGTQLDPKLIVTVGVVATVKKWETFDRKWTQALHEFHVTQFHMVDLAHFNNEFSSWRGDEERRKAFIARLVKEAKRGINKAFSHTVILPHYRRVDEQFLLTETVGGPYAFAQLGCLRRCEAWMQEKKPRFPVEFLVEQGDTGQDAFAAYLRSINDPVPNFIEKIDANTGLARTPLQAADLIAYEHRLLHASIADRNRLPAESKRRGSLRELRRMLPMDDPLISDEETMTAVCQKYQIPSRETP